MKICIQGTSILDSVYNVLSQYQHIDSITRMFAFDFKFPVSKRFDGWLNYDALSEYQRMGKFFKYSFSFHSQFFCDVIFRILSKEK